MDLRVHRPFAAVRNPISARENFSFDLTARRRRFFFHAARVNKREFFFFLFTLFSPSSSFLFFFLSSRREKRAQMIGVPRRGEEETVDRP